MPFLRSSIPESGNVQPPAVDFEYQSFSLSLKNRTDGKGVMNRLQEAIATIPDLFIGSEMEDDIESRYCCSEFGGSGSNYASKGLVLELDNDHLAGANVNFKTPSEMEVELVWKTDDNKAKPRPLCPSTLENFNLKDSNKLNYLVSTPEAMELIEKLLKKAKAKPKQKESSIRNSDKSHYLTNTPEADLIVQKWLQSIGKGKLK